MTVALAWLARRADGREHLYVAADSRTRGAYVSDCCPKIVSLPRSDCVLCFAGDTADSYPLILQMACAIGAHEPARERGMDITRLKDHLLRLCTDLVRRRRDPAVSFSRKDAEFIFGGYSWVKKDFCIWTVQYDQHKKEFFAREALSFHAHLRKAAFIGDWATRLRRAIILELVNRSRPVHLEPLRILAKFLQNATSSDTIGGPPQAVRIGQHMSTRPLCIRWEGEDTLFGRPLFEYENVDYWVLDPLTGRFERPRKFGYRPQEETVTERGEQSAPGITEI